ncbi:MAG TPA: hypothetical protein DCL61_12285 [Cyanobacteria bacterium UBA12227]|nr:hypothetical protein [Cyanobacteria bacterium UBA12227]HAX89141.1 hypothetical protein [Cyanobacteria bacterium UBA11370]HBY77258.1 hypothetical protein [Cyanobacteria bacterium UBA11148]
MKKLSVLTTFLPIFGLILGSCAIPNQPVGQELQEISQTHYQGSDDTQPQLTESSKLAINGIGPIRVGMTLEEAEKAARTKLIRIPYPDNKSANCFYVEPEDGLKGLSFKVVNDQIVLVEINGDNPGITTVSGAKIGDKQEQIESLYPEHLEVRYTLPGDNTLLTFVPKDESEQQYRMEFTIYDTLVTRILAGKRSEVEDPTQCF